MENIEIPTVKLPHILSTQASQHWSYIKQFPYMEFYDACSNFTIKSEKLKISLLIKSNDLTDS